ncbi:MAG: hypothetical protein FWF92_10510 [Oscillospiraceae bacterium]|nr:hypothetical protein [Oscillospiraceae bacterium]
MNKIKKINKFLFSGIIIIFMVYIIKYPGSSADIVFKGLDLCYFVIIPVIFPFLMFSKVFINSSAFVFMGKILNKPARFLFGVSGEYANAFFIGGILGFPIGAKTVREIYFANNKNKNKCDINKNEAERTLAFCNNCSISFAVSAVGISVFGSFKTGFYLFCIQLIAAVFTGIIIKFMFKSKSAEANFAVGPMDKSTAKNKINLTEIISESVSGILNICGTVLFFFIVTNVMFEYLKLTPFLTDMLNPEKHGIFAGLSKIIISGTFEISSGIYSLVNFNIPVCYKLLLASIILSWAGISVHFQIMYILKDTDLSFKPYFTGKIIHGIISVLITIITFGWFKIINLTEISETFAGDFPYYAYPNFLNEVETYKAMLIFNCIISLAACLVVIISAIIFYLFEKSSKKRKKYGVI